MSERPEKFEGTVRIAWTPDGPAPMAGWRFMISDQPSGTLITTVTELTLHASADATVWAELTMLADEDGNPARLGEDGPQITGICLGEDGEPLTATFAYEVAGMTGEPRPEPRRFQYPVGAGGGHE